MTIKISGKTSKDQNSLANYEKRRMKIKFKMSIIPESKCIFVKTKQSLVKAACVLLIN